MKGLINIRSFVTVVISVFLSWLLLADFGASSGSPVSVRYQDAFDRVLEKGSLRCAYIPYDPYFKIDPLTGKKSGLFFDVVEEAGKKMNLRVEWVEETTWATLTEGLVTGRYDAVCSGVWQNTERSMHALFSRPVGYASVYAYARRDDSRFDDTLDSINTPAVKVSVMDGEIGQKVSRENFPKAAQMSLPQTSPFSDLFLNVANGKADVVFAEAPAVAAFLRKNPDKLKRVGRGRAVASFGAAIVIPHSSPKLKSAIDSALSEIINSYEFSSRLELNGLTSEAMVLRR